MALDIFTETTQKEILAKLQLTNAYLSLIAGGIDVDSYEGIQKIVQSGQAANVFSIGQQINTTWTDTATGTVYDCPMDIVHFDDVTLEDGSVVPGMFLQAHWASFASVQFDQSEALYYCEEALPAGTYNFTIGTTWGNNCVADTTYQFTTTVDIPAGGQVRIGQSAETTQWGAPDVDPANWRVWTYESNSSASALEGPLELAEGSDGTSLGTTITSTIKYADSGINNLQRAAYGYNRWSQSAYRQYLNSAAAKSEWWKPQNVFDRAPAQLDSYPGFLSGFESDFLSVLKPVKVTTALNTATDSDIGTTEDTYDTFFLPSIEQMYGSPQLADVEGPYWEYWKEATGLDGPSSANNTGRIAYAINNATSAQHVRLRSANRCYANHVWLVYSAGGVGNYYASGAYRCAPGCVVC